jgi:hypothetical protein
MINNFAAFSGNDLITTFDLIRPNGLIVKAPVDYYYSKWGFLIPLEVNGLNVLEYLNGDRDLELTADGVLKAFIITHDGVLEEWSRAGPARRVPFMRRVTPWGPEIAQVRSNCMEVEEAWVAAMDATDDDLDRSLALVQQTLRNSAARITKLHIPTIIEELNKRFPLKDKKRQVRGTLEE